MNSLAPAHQAKSDHLGDRLLAHAQLTLPSLPHGPVLDEALQALQEFVDTPDPGAYVRAHGTLSRLHRDLRVQNALDLHGVQSFQDGIDALAAIKAVPHAVIDKLDKDLPRDAGAGRRISALATLLETWTFLAGRVREEDGRMKDQRPRRNGPKRK